MTALKISKISDPGYHRDNGDGAAHGLYLQVTRSGSGVTRSWIYRYVSPVTGKPRWMGLGPADVIGLAKARELAKAARESVTLGSDPIEQRRQDRVAARLEAARRISFGTCALQYIEVHKAGWKNEKHVDQWTGTFEGDGCATASINGLPVADVNTAVILEVLRPLWKRTPETASRVRGRIERVLAWATVSGLRQGDNPARWRGHLAEMLPSKGKVHRVKHHKAVPYSELPAFMQRLKDSRSTSALALEFTILCATRTNETINAEWSEIDAETRVWTIPATRMKSVREHRVPLSDRAMEILTLVPNGSRYVFPGAREGKPLSNMAMLELVRGIAGQGFTVHGFRSSFRDWCKEQTNYPREIAELALAHVVADKSEAAYSRGDALQKRAQLMRAWASYCGRSQPAPTANNLVALRAEAI
jgi:integrase